MTLGRDRYGVADPKLRRFRYGVQVNSLGLTEAQPENNVIRIVLEALGVTFSKKARCRALQLPAWNEALGLPSARGTSSGRFVSSRSWPTRRIMLEYPDLLDGSHVVEAKVAGAHRRGGARRTRTRCLSHGRCRGRGRERLHEAAARGISYGARCGRSKDGELTDRRREHLHGDRAVAAGGRRRISPSCKVDDVGRTRADRTLECLPGESAQRCGC